MPVFFAERFTKPLSRANAGIQRYAAKLDCFLILNSVHCKRHAVLYGLPCMACGVLARNHARESIVSGFDTNLPVSAATGHVDKQIREERKDRIRSMYLQCYTVDEIADAVGLPKKTVHDEIVTLFGFGNTSNFEQSANFQDNFTPPLYNIWSFGKKTNATSHFGITTKPNILKATRCRFQMTPAKGQVDNPEQRKVDNPLHPRGLAMKYRLWTDSEILPISSKVPNFKTIHSDEIGLLPN